MAIIPDGQGAAGTGARPVGRRGRALGGVLLALLLTPLCLVAAASQESGQEQTQKKRGPDYALIFVTVFGPDGRTRYGVPVKIRRADQKKASWQGYSDHAGEFAARVPAGAADYVVWADIKTPKGQPKPESKVHIEQDERADTSLHLQK